MDQSPPLEQRRVPCVDLSIEVPIPTSSGCNGHPRKSARGKDGIFEKHDITCTAVPWSTFHTHGVQTSKGSLLFNYTDHSHH